MEKRLCELIMRRSRESGSAEIDENERGLWMGRLFAVIPLWNHDNSVSRASSRGHYLCVSANIWVNAFTPDPEFLDSLSILLKQRDYLSESDPYAADIIWHGTLQIGLGTSSLDLHDLGMLSGDEGWFPNGRLLLKVFILPTMNFVGGKLSLIY